MVENKNWAWQSLKEAPFWRDGMTPEEYERESDYYLRNFPTAAQKVNYKPLWKQKQENIA